jgi:N6-L-threonylcarbamoyladenine synthase
VNHLEAHIFANFLADPALEFPFICLLVSGGHTQLWHVKNFNDYQLMGESRDDAAGEAFDKGARILGLSYPGGPEIEKLAKGGKPNAIRFPRAMMKKNNLEFSFSGLKTSLLYYMDEHKNANLKDVAASYQLAIIDVLITKLKWALENTHCHTCVIAGGVAANLLLRDCSLNKLSGKKVIFPDLDLCTDNAAMFAYLGELYLSKGIKSTIDFPILPNMKMA